MKPIHDRISSATTLLSPHAVPVAGTLGRTVDEPIDETRFPFQRDRDRIIHAQAFRRLQGKTQVFVAGAEDDHVRTRLTHTMEVAQLSRDIARTLGLNEDLAECVALAHDLGHPPFGHMGEEALDDWMRTHSARFEHNRQSLRIVTVLEEHVTGTPGLNLNREVLEGLQKHDEKRGDGARGPSLEAQVTDLADEIAYIAHDCDDGLGAGLFLFDDLTKTVLGKSACERTHERKTSLRGSLIHLLVSDLYAETERRLRDGNIQSLGDVYKADARLVGFADAMLRQARELSGFLAANMYAHPRVRKPGQEGQKTIKKLCETFASAPPAKILELQAKTGGSLPTAIKDYVAGMTDVFARRLVTLL